VLPLVIAVIVALALCGLALWLRLREQRRRHFRRRTFIRATPRHGFNRKKPEWVPKAIVRISAHMPGASCRHIAVAFNLRYAHKGESVGKTYVSGIIKTRASAILHLGRRLKNRVTRQGPRNQTWGADFTFLPQSPRRPILGVIDHGTRTLLTLQDLRARTIIALLRALFDLIEKFGRPQFLRTDNEPAFASPRFSVALWLVGVRHQRTEPHSPWQNGRIERFFWTLKERLLLW
jgi:transposase InsO family protein